LCCLGSLGHTVSCHVVQHSSPRYLTAACSGPEAGLMPIVSTRAAPGPLLEDQETFSQIDGMGCAPFAASDFWITLWAHLVWLGCYHGGSTAVGCWPSVIGVQPFAVGAQLVRSNWVTVAPEKGGSVSSGSSSVGRLADGLLGASVRRSELLVIRPVQFSWRGLNVNKPHILLGTVAPVQLASVSILDPLRVPSSPSSAVLSRESENLYGAVQRLSAASTRIGICDLCASSERDQAGWGWAFAALRSGILSLFSRSRPSRLCSSPLPTRRFDAAPRCSSNPIFRAQLAGPRQAPPTHQSNPSRFWTTTKPPIGCIGGRQRTERIFCPLRTPSSHIPSLFFSCTVYLGR
jgi:hypothetical protein